MEYTIDAKNRPLGRVATEAAAILRGKNSVHFAPNIAPDIKVVVENIKQIKISEKKAEQKEYKSFSGYPGGLKITPMKKEMAKKGIEYIFRKTVMGMLPKNKLRSIMIKNLVINK